MESFASPKAQPPPIFRTQKKQECTIDRLYFISKMLETWINRIESSLPYAFWNLTQLVIAVVSGVSIRRKDRLWDRLGTPER